MRLDTVIELEFLGLFGGDGAAGEQITSGFVELPVELENLAHAVDLAELAVRQKGVVHLALGFIRHRSDRLADAKERIDMEVGALVGELVWHLEVDHAAHELGAERL